MTHKRDCEPLFQEGYTNRNFDFVMDCVSENYIDRSPAGARSNADAVGILKIVAGQYAYLHTEMVDIFAENGIGNRNLCSQIEPLMISKRPLVGNPWKSAPDWSIL